MPKIKMIKEEMITSETPHVKETPKKTQPKIIKEKKTDKRHENKGRPTFESLGAEKRGTKLSVYVPESIKADLTELVIFKGKKSANELINEYFEKEIKKMKKKGKGQLDEKA